MRTLSLFLPGNFEDVYIYMGRLIILTAERSLRFYTLEHIIDDLETQLSFARPVLTYLFTRNDWLASTQFEVLLRNRSIREAFLTSMQQASREPYVEISTQLNYLELEHDLKIPVRVLLDFAVYNQRLYFGTDAGLYHLDAELKDSQAQVMGQPVKRLEARSVSTLAGYGAIHVSCGNDGLFSGFDEFGWVTTRSNHVLRHMTDKSVRTAWSGQDLVNYPTVISPVLLKGIHERSNPRGLEEEKIVLTDLNTNKISLDTVLNQAFLVSRKLSSNIRYVYNSNNSFFIYTDDGEFLTVNLRKRAKELTVKSSHAYETWNGKKRVLSMHPTGVGLILETDDQVLLFANGEFYPIVNSEVLSVRTFIKSRRYKNVVAITREDGVLITGLFQDHIEAGEE